jgi:hypothetical protein
MVSKSKGALSTERVARKAEKRYKILVGKPIMKIPFQTLGANDKMILVI